MPSGAEAISEALLRSLRDCWRRCEVEGGFQAAKRHLRRVIKQDAGGAARP